MDDSRFLTYVLWGLGTTLVYGIVLIRKGRAFRKIRDSRSIRELASSFGLFLTAFAANIAILAVLFGDTRSVRGFFIAIALGAFFATGVVMATDGSSGTKVGQ